MGDGQIADTDNFSQSGPLHTPIAAVVATNNLHTIPLTQMWRYTYYSWCPLWRTSNTAYRTSYWTLDTPPMTRNVVEWGDLDKRKECRTAEGI